MAIVNVKPVKDRIEVPDGNNEAVGRIIFDWIMGRNLPPIEGDIQILKDAFKDANGISLVNFPNGLETYEIKQSTLKHFVLRLPAPDVAEFGRKRACDSELEPPEYAEPLFYSKWVNRRQPELTSCEFFFCRVGDYTMNMCR